MDTGRISRGRGGVLVGIALVLALTACGRLTQTAEGGDDGSSPAGGGASSEPGSPGDPGGPTHSDPSPGPYCEPNEIPPNPNPDTPVSSCPGDQTAPPEDPQSTPVTPRPGMQDPQPVAWQRAEVGQDDRTLTLHFVSGVEPCYVLDRVEVDYGPDAVTVTLYEGHDPDATDQTCIEIALYKSVAVSIDEPLDGRKLVDGATA